MPRLSGNVIASWRPVSTHNDRFWLALSLHYVGRQLAPIAPTWRLEGGDVVPVQDPRHTEPQRLLGDVGIRLSDVVVRGVDLDATVFNLLDTRYRQGGSVVHPYPRSGRSYFVTMSYHVRP